MATTDGPHPPERYLTTNDSKGASSFVQHVNSSLPVRKLPDGTKIYFCYGSESFPVDLNRDHDLQSYQTLINNPPGIVVPNGFAFRIIDMPPGYHSVMHRTISVNFNVVIMGELELELDNGQTRVLKSGDSAIQRAVSHAWKNTSSTQWARIVAVPVPTTPLQLGDHNIEGTGVPGMSA